MNDICLEKHTIIIHFDVMKNIFLWQTKEILSHGRLLLATVRLMFINTIISHYQYLAKVSNRLEEKIHIDHVLQLTVDILDLYL